MKQAKRPFEFVAASYLIRIRPERAWNLAELAQHLQAASDDSIFYHTFQSLESHHYTTFSNDFAQWSLAACNETELAEQLAAIDLREFGALAELREALVRCVETYLAKKPHSAGRSAFEPFYFCEAAEVIVPLGTRAWNLAELAEGITRMSLHTLHCHFINARLRPRLQANDFSYWIEDSLELPELGERLNRIDFYTNTLEGIRREILQVLDSWIR